MRQLERLANILDNVGQVFLGGLVLPFFIDVNFNTSLFILGTILTVVVWAVSLSIE